MKSYLVVLGLLVVSTIAVDSLNQAINMDTAQYGPPQCVDASDTLAQLKDWASLIGKPPAELQNDKAILVQTRNNVRQVLVSLRVLDQQYLDAKDQAQRWAKADALRNQRQQQEIDDVLESPDFDALWGNGIQSESAFVQLRQTFADQGFELQADVLTQVETVREMTVSFTETMIRMGSTPFDERIKKIIGQAQSLNTDLQITDYRERIVAKEKLCYQIIREINVIIKWFEQIFNNQPRYRVKLEKIIRRVERGKEDCDNGLAQPRYRKLCHPPVVEPLVDIWGQPIEPQPQPDDEAEEICEVVDGGDGGEDTGFVPSEVGQGGEDSVTFSEESDAVEFSEEEGFALGEPVVEPQSAEEEEDSHPGGNARIDFSFDFSSEEEEEEFSYPFVAVPAEQAVSEEEEEEPGFEPPSYQAPAGNTTEIVEGNPSEPEDYSSEYDDDGPPAFEPQSSGNATQIVEGHPSEPEDYSSDYDDNGPPAYEPQSNGNATQIVEGHPSEPEDYSSEYFDDIPAYVAPPDTGNATQIVTGNPSEPSSYEYDDDIPAYVPVDNGNSSTPIYGAPPSEASSSYSDDDIPAYNPTPDTGNSSFGNSSTPIYGAPPSDEYSYSEDEVPAYNPTPESASGNDTNSSLPIYGAPPTDADSSSDDASLMMNLNNNDPQIAEQIPEAAKETVIDAINPETALDPSAVIDELQPVEAEGNTLAAEGDAIAVVEGDQQALASPDPSDPSATNNQATNDPMVGFDSAERFEKVATHKFLNSLDTLGFDEVNPLELEKSDDVEQLEQPEHKLYIPENAFIEIEELDPHHDHNHIHSKSNQQTQGVLGFMRTHKRSLRSQ